MSKKGAEKANNIGRDPKTGRFLKGYSGGTGRPPKPEHIRDAFRSASMEALDVLLGILRDSCARPADRIRAAEIILDRGYGKPVVMEVEAQASDSGGGVILLPQAAEPVELEEAV